MSKVNEDKKISTFLFLLKMIHFSITCLIFYYCWLLFRYGTLYEINDSAFRYNYYVLIGYGLLVGFFNRTYNAYLLGYTSTSSLFFSQSLSQLFSAGLVWIAVSFAWNKWHSPLVLIISVVIQCVLNCIWSLISNSFYFNLNPPKNTLFIYRNELDKRRFGTIIGRPIERIYHISKELKYDGCSFAEIRNQLAGYDAVFVAGVHSECRNGIAKYCKEEGIIGFFLPHVGDIIMQDARHIQSFDAPVLFITRSSLKPEYALIKRVFDVVVSGLSLIIFSPIMLITAIVIRLYEGGPVIYKQVRLTLNEKEFKILKFRSMRVDAEKDGVARLSSGDKDSRITPIGRVVRKCRLDELPQLINIFKGDMSFVGPRPERPEIAKQYYETLPGFRLRLQVKAGLTGYAQVYGKYNTEPYEKLEFDLMYINNMSLLTDIRLMFATFGILFKSESTEGIREGATTAMDYDK